MGYIPVLEVRNRRKNILLNKFNFNLEMTFDDVVYVNLNEISDYIENKLYEVTT